MLAVYIVKLLSTLKEIDECAGSLEGKFKNLLFKDFGTSFRGVKGTMEIFMCGCVYIIIADTKSEHV